MNGLTSDLSELEAICSGAGAYSGVDMLICAPFTLLDRSVQTANGSAVQIGAQDCHANVSGAHTGDISAEMIADLGAKYVILGHSERRADHGERSQDVHDKAKASWEQGLVSIICVGETLDERDAGQAKDVVLAQLEGSIPDGANPQNTVVAYEPVWAIGTGRVPENQDIQEMHQCMREYLENRFGANTGSQMRLLYGGSVKPGNAKEILGLDHVNGALVGGASLKGHDFLGIAAGAPQ